MDLVSGLAFGHLFFFSRISRSSTRSSRSERSVALSKESSSNLELVSGAPTFFSSLRISFRNSSIMHLGSGRLWALHHGWRWLLSQPWVKIELFQLEPDVGCSLFVYYSASFNSFVILYLNGEIPSNISQLTRLRLALSHNMLSGMFKVCFLTSA